MPNTTMSAEGVIESLDNAWYALCKQYRKFPNEYYRGALNTLGKIISAIKSKKTDMERSQEPEQISMEEWLEMIYKEGE